MSRPALELAGIFRQYGEAYRQSHRLPRHQLRLMRAIEICRTATLGRHVDQCDRNRHCPKCGSLARARWLHQRQGELPVPYLSAYFRRRFLEALEKLYRQGELLLTGTLAHLRNPQAFQLYLDPWRKADWVVYAKPPFGGPRQVLEYLGRYTHRVAISNHRLVVSLHDGQVTSRWKDYRHEQRPRLMTLGADEFIRRFLLHSLPDGFQRIRFSGFRANRHRRSKLALIQELLADPVTELPPLPEDCADLLALLTGQPKDQCPCCHLGRMYRIEVLPPIRWPDSS